jgi:hypothetical protein
MKTHPMVSQLLHADICLPQIVHGPEAQLNLCTDSPVINRLSNATIKHCFVNQQLQTCKG